MQIETLGRLIGWLVPPEHQPERFVKVEQSVRLRTFLKKASGGAGFQPAVTTKS